MPPSDSEPVLVQSHSKNVILDNIARSIFFFAFLGLLFWSFVPVIVLIDISQCLKPGIRVTVHNSGDCEMRMVKILGTGNYDLIGDIAPGESVSTVVTIAGEGHLEFKYDDPQGNLHHLVIDCYLEYYQRAAVYVSVNGDKFDRVKEEKAFWRHRISIHEVPKAPRSTR